MEDINDFCALVIERDLYRIKEALNSGKININAFDGRGFAPIHYLHDYTINHEYYNIVFDSIINYPGIDINLGTGNVGATLPGRTLLHLTDCALIVEKLLKMEGIEIDKKDNYGVTPLHWHIKYFVVDPENQYKICKMLVDQGADTTVAEEAFYNLHKDIVECKVKYREPFRDEKLLKEMISHLIDLPGFRPLDSLPMLELLDDEITKKIYQKWDLLDYNKFMEDVIPYVRNFRGNSCRVIKGIWTYIYKHKEQTTEKQYKVFFQIVAPAILIYSFKDSKEFNAFLEIYFKHHDPKFTKYDIFNIFRMYLDSKVLRRMIKYKKDLSNDFSSLFYYSFLYTLTHSDCDLNRFLADVQLSKVRVIDIHLMSRYCILPKNVLEYFKDNVKKDFFLKDYEINNLDIIINEMERLSDGPKSLKEISRNVVRFFLAKKYGVVYPYDMERILDQLKLSPIYKEIIMLERPIYPQIKQPVYRNNNFPPLINPGIKDFLCEDGAEESFYCYED